MKLKVPIKDPKPDFEEFKKIIKGYKRAEKVHFVELQIDEEVKKKFMDQITVLGGVDVDQLCNSEEKDLRKYVRKMLEDRMPFRYALGSGNSIANYIPIENYLIMLDEGIGWK